MVQTIKKQHTIRKMLSADIPAIALIESHVHSHPWTEGIFKDCFKENYESFVLKNEEKQSIDGYLITQTILDECHILTIGVKKKSQHQGLATQLLQFFIDQKQESCQRILLEVRESNQPAIHLYKNLGFECIALRKNYYQDTLKNQYENALIFEKNLR